MRLVFVDAAIAMLRRLSTKAANHMMGEWFDVRDLVVFFPRWQVRMEDIVSDTLPHILDLEQDR